ncbi:serine hydrolase domain-containing protein, partial [Streptomyces palmae]
MAAVDGNPARYGAASGPDAPPPVAAVRELVRGVAALTEGERPWAPGAVVLAGQGERTLAEAAYGWAVRYAGYDPATDRGVELPPAARVPARIDTVFDLASLTKLGTAVLAVWCVERGTLDPDRPVAEYAPELTAAAEHRITARQLLTHTSGLRPELPLYDCPGQPEREAALFTEQPIGPPGGERRYSDLNPLLLQRVLERITGRTLDRLLAEVVTGPLGMRDTCFRPPAALLPRIAATEDQRRPWAKLDRGMLRGRVHDENAHALGGVAGHAGLFGTVRDLARLCRMLLGGGTYQGVRVLAPASVDLLLTAPGLGFEVDQPWYMGELAGQGAAGHTGFTGTSLVLDRATGAFLVLLANTVHPVRRPTAGSTPRAAAATALA